MNGMDGDEVVSNKPDAPRGGGVFVVEDMSLILANLSFSIDADGRMTVSRPVVHLRLDQTPVWLRIAIRHLVDANGSHARVMEAHAAGDDQAKGRHLSASFVSGMQAVVAAATAMDAFYATVKSHISLDDELVAAWQRNRTARYKQVAEVLRRGFALTPRGAVALRRFLRQLATRRDQAVHPGPEAQEAVLHPDLGVGVEWRFVAFGHDVAHPATQSVLRIINGLTSDPERVRNEDLRECCSRLAKTMTPIVATWEDHFGPLHE